ncbi:TPA: conjugal transfer protein, partial [Escherichia coli]|nr:conjugal transfer protein [Escherichia coli]
MNKNHFKLLVVLFMAMFAGQAFAGGGLDAGTTALSTIKTWLF